MCILDISKLKMYSFHNEHIIPTYGDRAKLFFTDTDSQCYHIATDNVYSDMHPTTPLTISSIIEITPRLLVSLRMKQMPYHPWSLWVFDPKCSLLHPITWRKRLPRADRNRMCLKEYDTRIIKIAFSMNSIPPLNSSSYAVLIMNCTLLKVPNLHFLLLMISDFWLILQIRMHMECSNRRWPLE